MARFAVCVSTLFLASATLAQEPPAEPEILVGGGMPPSIGVVEGMQNGKLIFRQTVSKPATATRTKPVTEKVEIDGQVQEKTVYKTEQYTKMVTESVSLPVELSNVRVFDTNGVPIAASRLPVVFTRPRIVLFAPPGVQVDPAYLKVAKEGTPFIALLSTPGATPKTGD